MFADVLADPVKSAAAAGTGMVVDIDDHFDARKMGRQCDTVRATPRGARQALGGRMLFGISRPDA